MAVLLAFNEREGIDLCDWCDARHYSPWRDLLNNSIRRYPM